MPEGQVRYDAAINRVIEDIESRHGMRRSRGLAPGESAKRDPLIDDATVQEIETLYERKRQQDQARGRRDAPQDPPASEPSARPAPLMPGSAPPPSSGGKPEN